MIQMGFHKLISYIYKYEVYIQFTVTFTGILTIFLQLHEFEIRRREYDHMIGSAICILYNSVALLINDMFEFSSIHLMELVQYYSLYSTEVNGHSG